jgi:hypothetical protein
MPPKNETELERMERLMREWREYWLAIERLKKPQAQATDAQT